jgi:hypothetical protein
MNCEDPQISSTVFIIGKKKPFVKTYIINGKLIVHRNVGYKPVSEEQPENLWFVHLWNETV